MKPLYFNRLSAKDIRRLESFHDMLKNELSHFIGYPINAVFDYSELYKFLDYPTNNVGDPYLPSNYHLNSHEFECEVVSFFSGLTGAPGSTWGYVTNGGTEGNMYGIFLARELLPEGIVYYSEDTHYSVNKILRCLHIRSVMIRSNHNGSIDLEDLRETIKIHRDVPPIVFANIGTTMKGAVDDLEGINKIFKDMALTKHYVHADCALGGMILPFIDNAPPWDFSAGVDSISISGHKMVGSPIPCGVVLAKKNNVDRIAQSVEYIGTQDTTLTGSRNALTPLFLWYAIKSLGFEGFRKMVNDCMVVADYAIDKLKSLGLNAWRHNYSNTVVFDRPSMKITGKWQLACHNNLSHLITMPHVTKKHIDDLAEDINNIHKTTAPVRKTNECAQKKESIPQKKQITIVCPHTPTVINDVTEALASSGINIDVITSVTAGGNEIMRLCVSDYKTALRVLNQTSFGTHVYGGPSEGEDYEAVRLLDETGSEPVSEDAVLVALDDRPGMLAEISRRLLNKGIDLRSMRTIKRAGGKAVMAIASPEPDRVRECLGSLVIS